MALFCEQEQSNDVWFLDSGCSNHMCGTKSLFKELNESDKTDVMLGDSKKIRVEGRGTISIKTNQGNAKILQDVMFVPSLSHNLLSIGQLMISGYSILFDDGVCIIKDKKSGQITAKVSMAKNKMFPLEVSMIENYAMIANGDSETQLWHLRYGHLNINGLKLLREKEMVFGLPKLESLVFCEGCVYGKQSRKPFPVGKAWRASKCLELVHADLCGPMNIESLGGSRYFLLFTDDCSRMSWVYFLENKSEAFDRFKKFKAVVERASGLLIKTLRTDRGGEFVSADFNVFCEENGICRELTAPYTPEQNGVAERKNRTVVEMARSMIQAKGLPIYFWAEAVATAVYLLNLSPTKAVRNQTPFEAWTGRKPTVSHLKVFGCIAYALVKTYSRKFDERSAKYIFVGYSSQSKAFKLYNPISGKITISRDVVFNEDATWIWNEENKEGHIQVLEDNIEQPLNPTPAISSPDTFGSSNPSVSASNESSSSSSSSETPPRNYKSLQEIYASCTFALLVSDPICFEEAGKKKEWCKAMEEELSAIQKNQTWDLVDLPEGKNVIGLKWVFKTKYHADGSIQKHKARLVVKGYSQQQDVDFYETFSPVARFETVRTFLALAAQLNWPVYQFDVKSAFLNGDLEEEVYVSQPEGFVANGNEDKVYRLKKALYGLKQAPRAWYFKIDSYFQESGFKRSENEPTLYLKKTGKDEFLVVCLYVDDMIYMGSNELIIAEFKTCMMKKFEMTDLGLLHYFLGLEVKQGFDGIFISQRKYAMDLLKKFNMLNCKVEATPMNINEKLSRDDNAEFVNATYFRSLVGGLNYLCHTRPDIAFSVGVVSRFMHNPSTLHLGAAKRILRYVAGTAELGIWYSKVSNFKLTGYTDSDHAGCMDDRRSTSGFLFNLGSGAISWSSKKQEVVALSSSEAEYISATTSASQAIWLRRLLADFNQKQAGATEIFCDSMSAIAMTKNQAYHSRTKHIDIRYHFIRSLVTNKDIVLKFCNTKEQVADILTKALPLEKQENFRKQMGVCNFESRGSVKI